MTRYFNVKVKVSVAVENDAYRVWAKPLIGWGKETKTYDGADKAQGFASVSEELEAQGFEPLASQHYEAKLYRLHYKALRRWQQGRSGPASCWLKLRKKEMDDE